ncbi:DUF3084 domain-containing protein [Ancylothrix sp. C2]|uniref:DUF3084 domain-containing protein n=1 Tax=Ancylothrix sp. D3o TaxID=2953691 RepID=UPI0021BB94DB|nr:DUF3084 domain-containing protein [Ancylothrix sp. D3o]MCT7951530.1 DUF3084 domain-containing protein [Ancylothrix sp. D3o]
MTIGIILIVSILILGGVLATAGDRIGTKVGKARLSLFNLRPKKTATLVTIITGVSISATTLGILFATSKPLRKGVFEYDQTQAKLRQIRRDLEKANTEKNVVEAELNKARNDQSQAQANLDQTNRSLQGALQKLDEAIAEQARKEQRLETAQRQLSETVSQKQALQQEIEDRQAERQALIQQLEQGKSQIFEQNKTIETKNKAIAQKAEEIAQRNQELAAKALEVERKDQELAEKAEDIQEKDLEIDQKNVVISKKTDEIEEKTLEIQQKVREIEQKNTVISQQETRFKELESQQAYLEQEVEVLGREVKELQQGTIVLRRNQVIVASVVRVLNPAVAGDAVDRLLREANEAVVKATQLGQKDVTRQVISMTQAELDRLVNQIDDGQDYVVRIISAANYVAGEKQVQVFADAVLNRVVFQPGEVVAATSVDPQRMSVQQSRQRIEQLLQASSFRARHVGILGDTQVADGKIETIINFLSLLEQQSQPVDIRAVAADLTYTSGPLKLELVAIRNGQIVFQTSFRPPNF